MLLLPLFCCFCFGFYLNVFWEVVKKKKYLFNTIVVAVVIAVVCLLFTFTFFSTCCLFCLVFGVGNFFLFQLFFCCYLKTLFEFWNIYLYFFFILCVYFRYVCMCIKVITISPFKDWWFENYFLLKIIKTGFYFGIKNFYFLYIFSFFLYFFCLVL